MNTFVCDVCGYVYDPAKGDPDGGEYDRNNSYVKYTKSVGYCAYLVGSKRIIKRARDNSNCVMEEYLTSRSYVFDK